MSWLDDREPELQTQTLTKIFEKTISGEITEERGHEICRMLDDERDEYYNHKISYEELEKRSWEIIKKELG